MSNRIREEFIQKKEPVRLNKYLSEAGVCSRREADRLIESGKVTCGRKACRNGNEDVIRDRRSKWEIRPYQGRMR